MPFRRQLHESCRQRFDNWTVEPSMMTIHLLRLAPDQIPLYVLAVRTS